MPPPPPIGLNLSTPVSYPTFIKPSPTALQTLQIGASGVGPNVARVDFVAETVMGRLEIGSAIAAPWSVAWQTAWVGQAWITVIARDAYGNVVGSCAGAIVTITVG